MDKEIDLDALFAEAAGQRTEPSEALTARILADAARLQAVPQNIVSKQVSAPLPGIGGWLSSLSRALGGMRGLAGLSLAGVAGVYLGMVQPAGLAAIAQALTGASAPVEEMDLLPASGTLWAEN